MAANRVNCNDYFDNQLTDGEAIEISSVTGRDGDDFLRRINEIIGGLRLGRDHSGSLAAWMTEKLSTQMQEQLVKVGLMRTSRQLEVKLGDFLDKIIETTPVKASTKITYGNVIRNLIAHFERNCALSSIGAPEAFGFRAFLNTPAASANAKPLSKATVSRRIIMARQFFTVAMAMGHITDNPFKDIKAGNQRNKKRQVFVQEEWVNRMVETTNDMDWKVILVLARFGGHRLPSEIVRLQWKHVDFKVGGNIGPFRQDGAS